MKKGIIIIGIVVAIVVVVILGMRTAPQVIAPTESTTSDMPLDTSLSSSSSSDTSSAPSSMTSSDISSTSSSSDTQAHSTAVFTTSLGKITIELFDADAPKTVENFMKLAQSGFYNGTRFHRVIEGFMIQGGDPQSKDVTLADRWGMGGPGYQFADEIHANNRNMTGTLAMANAGPNTNGSQFFINVADNNFLDTKHTVFGRVIEGMDIVMKISAVETLPNDRPIEDVILQDIAIR